MRILPWWNGYSIALKAELFVALRSRLTGLLLLLPALATLTKLTLLKVGNLSSQSLGAMNSGAAVSGSTGYGALVEGWLTGFLILYLVFIGVAAYSFSIERERGTLRHLAIRSASRRAIIAAKYAALNVTALASAAIMLGVGLATAYLLWPLVAVVEDGFELINVATIHSEIVQGLSLALLPLPSALALGLLISVLARSATQAVALALGVTLAIDIFKSFLGSAQHYLYSAFHPALFDRSYLHDVAHIVSGFSDSLVDERVLQLNYWLPLPQALALFALCLLIGRRIKL